MFNDSKNKPLEVPYYSQYLDIVEPFWMPRACGMCCFKMILDFHKKETPSLIKMCEEGKENGGYGKSGWIHDYFVKKGKEYGLSVEREEKMDEDGGIQKIKNALDKGEPVIVSIAKRSLGRSYFHMIVLTGYEEDLGFVRGFYYHEPESLSREEGEHRFVELKDFMYDWRRMAIFFRPA